MIDQFILTEMLKIVKQVNANYPADPEHDFAPLRKIGQFIYRQLSGQDILDGGPSLFIDSWRILYTVAYEDEFYRDKSLATIANHIQEFFQKAKNGSKQISGSKLKDKLAARFRTGG